MTIVLDHLILHVNDVGESSHFYMEILGLTNEGQREPFTILLAPWGTEGGEDLAFTMSRMDFGGVFRRVRVWGAWFSRGEGFSVGARAGAPVDCVGSC